MVLAVRNLCENNKDNQAVVAGMTKEGTVDCEVLLEMGLSLHADEDNKIVIVPLGEKNTSEPWSTVECLYYNLSKNTDVR